MGRIKSKSRVIHKSNGTQVYYQGKIIDPVLNSDGYKQFKICMNGKCITKRVHRAIAETFISNPLNLPEINHKDCNRANNSVENLEWCDHAYNVHYAIENGNHFCCRNLHGENNPNYHNNTLKKRYEENPELRKLLARKGAQNGKSKRVTMYDKNMKPIRAFDWIGACAQYLIDNKMVNATKINSVRNRIIICAHKHQQYYNHYFKFV